MFLRRTLQIGYKLRPVFRVTNTRIRTLHNAPKIIKVNPTKLKNKVVKLTDSELEDINRILGWFTFFYIAIIYDIVFYDIRRSFGFVACWCSYITSFIFSIIAWRIFWPLEICRCCYDLFQGRGILVGR